MPHGDSSLQSQSPLSQAQDSLDKVHHAVSQAQTHPDEQLITQAQHAIVHAENAIDQAKSGADQHTFEQVCTAFEKEKRTFQQLKKKHMD
ncbi:hypothetical protein [Longirhabdus pacifica]|uniref:hypothetical protein n=1 Tax=Longirhabdus pacifica TaxID=2305227 RepID=UPI001981AB52|nr:hypothetical protein [Longirhabdus pacifica]